MSIRALRDSIVSTIETQFPAFNTVKSHGGRFDQQELMRYGLRSPAALVTVIGTRGKATSHAGQATATIQFACYIVAVGQSDNPKDSEVLDLVELITAAAVNNLWAYSDAQAPKDTRMDNLYTGTIDNKGVALWAVLWTQLVDLAVFDVGTLDDFNQMNTDFDLAPADGVIDAQGELILQGAFMSAYGQLSISASVATSIDVAGTYQKAAGTTLLANAADVDSPVNGRLRHTGTVSKPFLVTAGVSVTVSGDAKVTLAIAKGGVVDETTEIEQEVTLAGGAEAFSLRDIASLNANEYVEVWVKADDTINVTLTKMNIVAAAT